MERHTDALHRLTLELRGKSNTPSGRRALRRLAAAGIDVGDATSLQDLVDLYHADALSKGGRAKAMLEGLLGLAPDDPDAALVALVALRPALNWVASRVYGRHPTDDDFAEVVAHAWEAIIDSPPKRGPKARYVVMVARNRTRTAQRRRAIAPVARDQLDDRREANTQADPAERPEPILACAVRMQVLSHRDAELIVLTRVVGIPLGVLIHDYGCTESALYRRRQRAESALRRRFGFEVRTR